MTKKLTGNQIRQTFIDFFVEHGHTVVPSMSLVPGGDSTLLFTNSGMVQFKDVFIGTDKKPYLRAVDSQKCMRVAGKHNDLEDVGRDNSHHTFFEMLGNWSFGDYYKAEAIPWAWQLLTEVWGLPRQNLWATCFEDEQGDIPRDDEAADLWRAQPGKGRSRAVRPRQRNPHRPRPRHLRQVADPRPRLPGQRRLRPLPRAVEPGLHSIQSSGTDLARNPAQEARRYRNGPRAGRFRPARKRHPL